MAVFAGSVGALWLLFRNKRPREEVQDNGVDPDGSNRPSKCARSSVG